MRVVVAIVGLFVGALAAAWVLLEDPLGLFAAAEMRPVTDAAHLVISGDISRGLSADPAGVLGLARAQLEAFTDPALRNVRLDVVLLDSADGGARALAVKVAAPRADNSLLRGRLVADSAWNLIWPGHGSLFLVGRDDYRTLLADRVFNALAGKGFRPSPLQQAITISPRLVGSGGRLAAAQGTYREYWSPGSGGELELGLEEN